MASTLNHPKAINTSTTAEPIAGSKGIRLCRFCELEESLGLIFGLMTVAYIVLSLFAVKP
jgi:hypothetical protein